MEDTKTKPTRYERRVVAFIDLLGFRAALAQLEEIPTLFDALTTFMTGMAASPGSNAPADLQITAFSDCLCLSTRVGELPEVTAMNAVGIMWLAAHAAREILAMGIMTRGGITTGNLYHRGAIVIGRGLVEAYELEQAAQYPRIVVAEDLAASVNALPAKNTARLQEWPSEALEARPLQRDFDGAWIVNGTTPRVPSGQAWEEHGKKVRKRFKTIAMHLALQLMGQLSKKPPNADVVAKLRWQILRFNPELAKAGLAEIDIDHPMKSIIRYGPEADDIGA